jgi:hypothetical protein
VIDAPLSAFRDATIAQYLGVKCLHCGFLYQTTEHIRLRDARVAGWKDNRLQLVCLLCWPDWQANR